MNTQSFAATGEWGRKVQRRKHHSPEVLSLPDDNATDDRQSKIVDRIIQLEDRDFPYGDFGKASDLPWLIIAVDL
ncbi:hypothetical protein BHYA_0156g00260 [Botrytis hyacinthi]|uniref:Uncharacterized protein n=1 Tax=Botrytis hyacinthi TaxID=278943 RepID=A0A4Z1GJ19_9HELO|nr:hypothetical protein BHYA_0156g00260 [Botrytis hyacinthi]